MIYHILQITLLKINVKNQNNKEEITVNFVNDNIKNYYIMKAINDEFNMSNTSQILSGKSIIEETKLINFIINHVSYD